MKKCLILLLAIISFSGASMLLAQSENKFQQQKEGKKINVNQILERMEQKKQEVLTKIRNRFEKLNNRLSKLSKRVNNASERIAKFRNENSDNETRAKGEEKLSERKAKATQRYNQFKENITKRKAQLQEQFGKRKEKLMKRVHQLDDNDKDKVLAAFNGIKSEIKQEVEKLSAEALKKIETTYQKIMAL